MPKKKKKIKRLIKGSKAAKAYMARLRGMKKTGRKKTTGKKTGKRRARDSRGRFK